MPYNYQEMNWPAPRVDRTSLSEDERAAIALTLAVESNLPPSIRLTLGALLERTAPRSKVRYVVHCKSRFAGKVWDKTYYDKAAAQNYARHAVATWCDRKDVRIVKQKWIAF